MKTSRNTTRPLSFHCHPKPAIPAARARRHVFGMVLLWLAAFCFHCIVATFVLKVPTCETPATNSDARSMVGFCTVLFPPAAIPGSQTPLATPSQSQTHSPVQHGLANDRNYFARL